jgi:hypothetical protein
MYIIDSHCISAQETWNDIFFDNAPLAHHGNRYPAIEPDYKGIIPGGLLRRMGKAVRMGVGAGLPLLQKYSGVGGIILGTANGGLEDCLKFLNQIVDYEEGTLTPTNFVQSTPNAIAGSLALMNNNTQYNITHVHNGLAFEAAILDCLMLLQEGAANQVLVGNVEEISDYNYNIDFLSGSFKLEEVSSVALLDSNTPGTVCGEGSAMFMMSATRPSHACIHLLDVLQISYSEPDCLMSRFTDFLDQHHLSMSDIDTLFLGVNGDSRYDGMYSEIEKNMSENCQVITYKNMVGDYPTVSAFALWLAVKLTEGKSLPTEMMRCKNTISKPKNILIYNHNKGIQHGLILLKALDAME